MSPHLWSELASTVQLTRGWQQRQLEDFLATSHPRAYERIPSFSKRDKRKKVHAKRPESRRKFKIQHAVK